MTLTIHSKHNDPEELEVVEIVKSMCDTYDVPCFTHEVSVEKGAIPHSHPVLTLNTRSKDKRAVLSTFVHEQFHWYAQGHPKYADCISYLKTAYDDDGEHNKSGTYPNSYWEHIIVCFNTRNYLQNTLPLEDLDWVYSQWLAYPTLETLIVEKYGIIESDLKRFGMIFAKRKSQIL